MDLQFHILQTYSLFVYNDIWYLNFSHLQFNNSISKYYINMNILFSSSSASQCTEPVTQPQPGPFLITKDDSTQVPKFKISELWSINENCKFVVFCNKYEEDMRKFSKKEKWTLFKDMAKFIKTRTYTQCKNYYSKCIRTYGTIESLIQHLKDEYTDFQVQLNYYVHDLEGVKQRKLENKNMSPLNNQPQMYNFMNMAHLNQLSSSYQDSFNLNYNSLQQLTSPSHSIQSSVMRMFYPITKQQQYLRKKQHQIMECHRLFRLWVQKVKQLMDITCENDQAHESQQCKQIQQRTNQS